MTGRTLKGALSPLFAFSPLTVTDEAALRGQMRSRRFDDSRVLAVARRCRWGFPQVILCDPLGPRGPFPTTFWLTCPHLDRLCGVLEGGGAVRELEAFLAPNGRAWIAYHEGAILLRLALLGPRGDFLRRFRPRLWEGLRGGPGGTRLQSRPRVKCLHLQVASWLGRGRHPGEVWLRPRLEPLECDDPDDRPCGGAVL